MTDIAGLIERLEKATGPDRELDALLWCWRQDYRFVRMTRPEEGTAYLLKFDYEGREYTEVARMVPSFTASQDAALDLVQRVRPGWCWRVEKCPPTYLGPRGEPFWATCGPPGEQEAAHGYTPAIALLIALLRTLETEQ